MDDDTLIARIAADLDGAFDALVLAHQDRLYTIALRILGDPRDAEEVAQDAFVRAYRALTGYEADRIRALRLRGWLATIAVNLARNRATRRRPPPSVSLDATHADGRPSPAETLVSSDPSTLPLDQALRTEDAREWAVHVAALPIRYRIPIVLRHVDGLSFAEMAESLGRPEGTLKAQVHRGLSLLRVAHAAAATHDIERAGDAAADDPAIDGPVLAPARLAQEMPA